MTIRKGLARARLVLRQNWGTIGLLLAWYGVSYLLFLLGGHAPGEAALLLVYAQKETTTWGTFYLNVSDFVVFGAIVGILFGEAGRKYKPEETSRLLSAGMRDHVILVGYTHIAERLRELFVANGVPVAIVEADRAKVDALVRQEEPVVLGTGRQHADLVAAGVKHAKMVIAAMEDIESAALVASHVRHENRSCALLVRCYDDDVGAVLAKTYDARIVSTSKMAAQYVASYAQKHGTRACVVVGAKNLGLRVALVLKECGTKFVVVDPSRQALDDLAETDPIVCGSALDPEVLTKADVEHADLVVLTGDDLGANMVVADRVRDLNKSCRIVARAFHDDSAEMLARSPFSCDVISTSKHAVKMLVDAGAFKSLGVGAGMVSRAPAKTRRAPA
jgi:Trk K+ transport system NAD-binding subunit